jgi:hypothetical protein
MNKKANTLLFIVGATIFNILLTIASFFILFLLYARFVAPLLPENIAAWGFPLIFLGSIAVSFVVYRFILNLLIKKIDVDKYFDPIFKGRRPSKPRD